MADRQKSLNLNRKDRSKKLNDLLEVCNSPDEKAAVLNSEKLFWDHFGQEQSGIKWNEIQELPTNAIMDYSSLEPSTNDNAVREMLQSLVIIKLNGGLGTSMGCKGPKSLIPVRGQESFLDLAFQQVMELKRKYDVDIPIVLMNSFNTEGQTLEAIKSYSDALQIHCFTQSKYPRIHADTLVPIPRTLSHSEGWYPPGHGDFYLSFCKSGLFEKFLRDGKRICFVSNVDNVGATVDLSLLHTMHRHNIMFLIEVTDRTEADVKGGTLIQHNDRLRLLEVAQVPEENLNEFQSVSKFKTFKTNNIWISLHAMKDLMSGAEPLKLDVIANPKKLIDGTPVLQLETAIGAAIKYFDNAAGVNVPRNRFLPVKKTSDLLLLMSDLYHTEEGRLVLSPRRQDTGIPVIQLSKDYKKVGDFLKKFHRGAPSLLALDSLVLEGDVTFGADVILTGHVAISEDEKVIIPSGTLIKGTPMKSPSTETRFM